MLLLRFTGILLVLVATAFKLCIFTKRIYEDGVIKYWNCSMTQLQTKHRPSFFIPHFFTL